ncbi:serine/threonine protein kinase [Pasteurellaceae bacterium RH1A]|nr:serine/threonine protein kinase [Pasteurellaceae bacterium RH1A]
MSNLKLTVAMNGMPVGEWRKLANGATEFQYFKGWIASEKARAISLSLPLSGKPYRGDQVYNFFDNLLPDSELIRSRIQQRFQVSTKHPFDLLSVIGQDCVGAIQLYQEGKSRPVRRIYAEPLSESEIESLLKNYQYSPLGMQNHEDFRISLAGAQEKTALLLHNNQWCRPLHTTPTSHIFKLPIGMVGQGQLDLSKSCENEWLCLKLMKMFGLAVPEADIMHFGDTTVLVVKRFDRRWSKRESWLVRLPQEDFCQALNIAPARKYESDGGPSMGQILSVLNGSVTPVEDRKHFLKAQIVFWLLCAIDGHAKNFSLFLEQGNRYRLTPFYDVISAYPLISEKTLQKQKVKMAMAWQGENKHYLWHKIQPRHFYSTAKLAAIAAETVDEILHEILRDSTKLSSIKTAHLPSFIADPILEGLSQQLTKL